MILGIVGSRNYNNYGEFSRYIDDYIKVNGIPLTIVSGGAKGADAMAKTYAYEHGIPIHECLPDLSLGNYGYLKRNQEIVDISTEIIAFPSQNSKGTYDTIRKATLVAKKLTIYNI